MLRAGQIARGEPFGVAQMARGDPCGVALNMS